MASNRDDWQDVPVQDDWQDVEIAPEAPSQVEAGLRGIAQGASFGLEDELAGLGGAIGSMIGSDADTIESTHPEVQAEMQKLAGPKKSFGDLYRESRDDERARNRAAEEANPGTYFATNIAGAIPFNPTGAGLKGFAALGAAQGAGASEADLTKGDIGKAALDTGLGAGFGAAGYGLGKLIPKVVDGTKFAGKKFLTTLGPTEEAIDARLAGRAQDSAKSYTQLADDMTGSLKDLQGQIQNLDQEAWQTLSTEANVPREYVSAAIDDALKGIGIQGKAVGATDRQVYSALNSFKNDINQLDPNISERDLKSIIKTLDDNINWDDQSQNKLNGVLQGLRQQIDETLKFRNPNYRVAMEPVAERADLLGQLKKQFSFSKSPGEGLVPTDASASKIKTSLNENKAVTQKNLGRLRETTGSDFEDLANDYQLAQQFEKTGAQGSRRTALGAALGTAVGTMAAPGMGSAIGGALGASAGATLDRYGGQLAGKIIDTYMKAENSALFGKFKPVLDRAAKEGPEALSLIATMLSRNPEFRKTMGIDEQSEIEVTAPYRRTPAQGGKGR